MSRVLITGGTGFVGSHTVDFFLRAGWTVRALVRDAARLSWLKNLPIEIAVGELHDYNSLASAVRDCQCIVHCAGLTKAVNTKNLYDINGISVGEFAKRARDAGVKRFVLCSTQAVAGPSLDGNPVSEDMKCLPISEYGRSKLLGEQLLMANAGDMEWIILRPAAIMGPRDEQFLSLYRGIVKWGIYPKFGSGLQRYSFVSVFDMASALLAACQRGGKIGATYYIAYPLTANWQEVSEIIAELAGRKVRAVRFPDSIIRATGAVSDAVAKVTRKPALVSRDKVKEILTEGWICSSEKIMREWGFQFNYDARKMVIATFEGYRAAGRL